MTNEIVTGQHPSALSESFLEVVFPAASRTRPECARDRASPYDRAAAFLEEHIDRSPLDFAFESP